jgi:hypothetical protein
MSKKRRELLPPISEKRRAKAQSQRERDAYRAALGLTDDAKLPKNLGNTASAGGGRDRRGKVSGCIGDSPGKRKGAGTCQRARLIG